MFELMLTPHRYNFNLLNLRAFYKPLGSDGRLTTPFEYVNGRGGAGAGVKALVTTTTPYGVDEVYEVTSKRDASNSTHLVGGWTSRTIAVDPTKTYRLSTWVRMSGNLHSGNRVYVGCNDGLSSEHLVLDMTTGVENPNPYFINYNDGTILVNEWVLVVGYIHAHDSVVTHLKGGLYLEDGSDITPNNSHKDYRFKPTCTKVQHRTYSYYGTKEGVVKEFYHPRIDLCDGNEAPISRLLKTKHP